MNYTNIQVEIKYSTIIYVWLCFRHAAQEAMRGENVSTDIITPHEKRFYTSPSCVLCAMTEAETENRVHEWYENYRKNK